MKRSWLLLSPLAMAAVASTAFARPSDVRDVRDARAAAPALPALPSGDPAASPESPVTGAGPAAASNASPAPKPATAAAAPTPQQLYERVRKGIVALERNGVPVAIGTVLDGDGRVLTSLSGLGGADAADIRYADGTSVHAKVGHSDKESDLALLVPQSGKWTDGLSASEADPVGAPLRAMLPGHGSRLGPTEAGIKGRADAHARDGGAVGPVLDVDIKGPLVAGAPLLDATGNVVAVLVRACKGAPPASADAMAWAAWATAQDTAKTGGACIPTVVGAPVTSIRSFLSKTPAGAAVPAAWLGIRGEPLQDGAVRGVRVLAVAPSSPAEKASLRPNADVIVAADGHPIDSPEKLAQAIGKHAPGETVKLLVYGDEKFREVAVALKQAP